MKDDDVEPAYIREHDLDIYGSSTCDAKKDVIIAVHGGAWVTGSKKCVQDVCYTMAKRGYVCVAGSYRLSSIPQCITIRVFCIQLLLLLAALPINHKKTRVAVVVFIVFSILTTAVYMYQTGKNPIWRHPTHVLDVCQSIQWVYNNIHVHGGNNQRIFLLGHSAGAHIVSLVGLNNIYLKSVGLDLSVISGIVSISGVYSLDRLRQNKIVSYLLEKCVFDFRQNMNTVNACPISCIVPNQYIPPFLLVVAEVDGPLAHHMIDMFYALQNVGAVVFKYIAMGTTHFTIHTRWGQENTHLAHEVDRFVQCISTCLNRMQTTL